LLIIKIGCIFAVLNFKEKFFPTKRTFFYFKFQIQNQFPMTCMRVFLRIVGVALIFTFAQSVQAQTDTIVRPYVYNSSIKQGSTVDLYVRADNFKNIYGAQFSVHWNPAVLQFVSTTAYNLTGLVNTNFGTTEESVNEGVLRFSWYDNSAKGVTLPNKSHLFAIRCKAIGKITDTTNIYISGSPIEIEFTGEKKEYAFDASQKAIATVGTVTAQQDAVSSDALTINKVSPNPFTENTEISFTLDTPGDVSVKIYDILGHQILNIKNFYNIGTHLVNIGSDVIPTAGTYTYTVATATTQQSGSLVKIQ
jgi:hypothetical protein